MNTFILVRASHPDVVITSDRADTPAYRAELLAHIANVEAGK
jgi:hypothetical protein